MSESQQPNGAPASPPEEPPKLEEIITPTVLNNILKGYKPSEPLKCLSFDAEVATQVGDNFMSVIYATNIHLQNENTKEKETLQVMLKCLPWTEVRQEMINEMELFSKEADMYQNVFPLLENFQRVDLRLPESLVYVGWPKCYAAHLDRKSDYLALENLKVSGYKMGDRKLGLDFNHCALVLRELAKFHALAYAKFGGRKAPIGEAFPLLLLNGFDPNNPNAWKFGEFFKTSLKSEAELLRNNGEPVGATRMDKIANSDMMGIMGGFHWREDVPVIIGHADCWVNNMLFKYGDGEGSSGNIPTDMKFLDFQVSKISSRFMDIWHVLYTSAKLDMFEKRERDLLLVYYSEFTRFSNILGVDTEEKGLSWEKFLEEGEEFRFYGILLGFLTAMLFAAESKDILNMDEVTKEQMENPAEGMKEFFTNMTSVSGVMKVKRLALHHLGFASRPNSICKNLIMRLIF